MKMKILLFSFISFSPGCNIDEKQSVNLIQSISVALVVDVTDKKKLWPLPDPTLAMFHCDKYPDAECRFTMQVISDKQVNPSFSCKLPNAATTEKENRFDDVQYRSKNIISFYTEVRNTFTDFYRQFDTTKSMGYSECWATVTIALQKLSGDKSDRKFLLIYSDLLERSDTDNAYRSLSTLSIPAVAEKLNNAAPVPQNLQGITVIIVYEPTSRDDDKRFSKMYAVYKFLLEQKGAQVLQQANNTNYAL